jgi:hypothetical protein
MQIHFPVPDRLVIALVVGIVAILIGIGCLAVVAWANAGSRNLALAAAALFASFILLIIQVPFELRSKTDTDFFSAEYTVDRSKPQIRAWKYASDVTWRIGQEIGASDALAESNPGAFKDDLGKLTDDMTIWSVASYMFADQFDWQLRKVRARGPTVGTFTTTEPLSKPVECTLFSRAQIAEKLASAGNAFANSGRFIREQLCLPPGSSVDIRAKSFAITNPFVHISFTLESTGGVRYGKPGTAGLETPSVADGGQQYETRVNSLRANVEYSWIRAQHRNIDKYKAWAERVVIGVQQWFEGADK